MDPMVIALFVNFQVMWSIMRACSWATEMVILNLHFALDMGSMADVFCGILVVGSWVSIVFRNLKVYCQPTSV